jgi:hypothetical protein
MSLSLRGDPRHFGSIFSRRNQQKPHLSANFCEKKSSLQARNAGTSDARERERYFRSRRQRPNRIGIRAGEEGLS